MPGLIGQHLPSVFVPNPPLGSSTLLFDNSGMDSRILFMVVQVLEEI